MAFKLPENWDYIDLTKSVSLQNNFVQAVYESYVRLVVGLQNIWYWHFCQNETKEWDKMT